MSHKNFAAAFDPAEAKYKREVMKTTWGHLAPSEGKSYSGRIVFVRGQYGDVIIISAEFNGLPDSLWLYDAMVDFVLNHTKEAGVVLSFEGVFKNYSFLGEVYKMSLKKAFPFNKTEVR